MPRCVSWIFSNICDWSVLGSMILSPFNSKPSRQVSSSLKDQYCLTAGDTYSLLTGHPLRITLLRAFSTLALARDGTLQKCLVLSECIATQMFFLCQFSNRSPLLVCVANAIVRVAFQAEMFYFTFTARNVPPPLHTHTHTHARTHSHTHIHIPPPTHTHTHTLTHTHWYH